MHTEQHEGTAYVPVWARPDSPTIGMSEAEMRAYYKRTDVQETLRFYLGLPCIPEEFKAVYRTLLADLDGGRKVTPADKELIRRTRYQWGLYIDGRPYVVPEAPSAPARARKIGADTAALNAIAVLLDGAEWGADTVDAIAQIVRTTGRRVADVAA